MGNQCCAPQLDTQEIRLEQVEPVEVEREERKGLPEDKVAIKLSEIPLKCKSDDELQKINTMVFKVVEYERKFKDPIRINRPVSHFNRLEQPYYIPSLRAFYVGQWIYNDSLSTNVPGGIGRLYEDGVISEGVFKTFLLNAEQDFILSDQSANGDQSEEGSDRATKQARKPDTEQNNIQKLLKHDRKTIINEYNFVVKLNGTGRVNSTQQNDKEQIVLEGEFLEGVLNGKGTLKMTTSQQESASKNKNRKKASLLSSSPNNNSKSKTSCENQERLTRKTEYFYSGFWKEGAKHGKGVEKVQYFYKQKPNLFETQLNSIWDKNERKTISCQSFKYEGTFFQNSKHGKGTLVFVGSPKYEHEVLKDIESMQNEMISEGENMKKEATEKVSVRRQKQIMIQKKLDEMKPPKQNLAGCKIQLRIERNLMLDVNFQLQRAHRTVFSESYVGDFAEGQMSGQGTYVWPNGKTYRGKWKENKLWGKGQFYWPDGTYFQGEYADDERTGEGIMVWNLTKRYRGSWAFGMRHGYGQSIQISKNEEKMVVKACIWDRDKVKLRLFQETICIKGFNELQKESVGQELERTDDNFINPKLILEHHLSTFSNSISPRQ